MISILGLFKGNIVKTLIDKKLDKLAAREDGGIAPHDVVHRFNVYQTE
jgi:hypothetical protein